MKGGFVFFFLTRQIKRTEKHIMGRLDTIATALADAKSAAASEHEQVLADLAALNQKAVDLQAAIDALTAGAVTDEEIADIAGQAAGLVTDINAIDPDALPTPDPTDDGTGTP